MSATAARPVTARAGRSGEPAAKRRSRGTVLYVTAGVLSVVIFVVPLLWAVFRSLQPSDLVTAYPTWRDFSHLTFSNYSGIFGGDIDLWRYVANSVMVALGTGVLVTIVSTLAGTASRAFASGARTSSSP